MPNLLSPAASNPKTAKQLDEYQLEGVILHLLSANQVADAIGRRVTVCPMAERNGCASACLVNQGRGRMRSVYRGRLRRTRLYFEDRPEFMRQLRHELTTLERRARRKGRRPIARLDGTSDLGLALTLCREFPGITFYDYTKVYARAQRVLREAPANYSVCFSRGAGNEADALEYLRAGGTVSVVFRRRKGEPLPASWQGFPVIDGDAHDFRYMDPPGVVVGLRCKGSAIDDRTGFVVDCD